MFDSMKVQAPLKKKKKTYFHVKMNSKVLRPLLTSNIMNNFASIPVETELCHLSHLLGGAYHACKQPQYNLKLQKEEARERLLNFSIL